jgi:hypothetical protein
MKSITILVPTKDVEAVVEALVLGFQTIAAKALLRSVHLAINRLEL